MANISSINGLLINAATASLATTASYATTAQNVLGSITSASYAGTASILLGSVVSASFASTASFLNPGTYNVTASRATSASYAATASYSTTLGAQLKNSTQTLTLASSDNTTLSSLTALTLLSFTGSLQGTSSWASNAVSASYAETSTTASYSTTLGATITGGSGGLALRNSAGTVISSITTLTSSLAIIASQSLVYKTTPGGNQGDNYIVFVTQSGADTDPRGIAFASSLGYNAVQNKLSVINVAATTLTGSLSGNITGSVLGTASFALNGGVTQIAAGTNVTISPTNGLGVVTINSTGGSGAAFPFSGNAVITGSLLVSGSSAGLSGITGSLLGTASRATTASHALTASYSDTLGASFFSPSVGNIQLRNSAGTTISTINNFVAISASVAASASFAATASYFQGSGDLASVQARRTTGFTLPATAAFITLDATDTETTPAVVAHDNVNTERIYVYSTGLYLLHYHADVGPGTISDFEFSVLKNALTTISGSIISGKNSSTDKVAAGVDMLVLLNANNYVALYGRSVGSPGGLANNVVFSVTKMEGVIGAAGGGQPGGSTTEIQYNNAGTLAGVPTLTYLSGHLKATGSFTGSFTGALLGSSSYALTASYALSSAGGGGGGTPGGTVNEVQYNDGAGGFAGATNIEISAAGNLLFVATTDPTTPSAGTLTMYSKTIAGRTLPKIKGPSGLDYVLQPALFQNANYLWTQNNTANGVWLNTTGTGVPTAGFSTVQPTTGGGGTNYAIQKRARYVSAATTTNQIIGQRNTEATFFRGAAAGQGGFFFYARFGFDTWTNGGRMFIGMATATTVVTADPSALNNTVGFCVDSADAGAISFLTRTTATGTKQPTGLTVSSGKGYDVFIFNAPNSGTFSYRIVDLNTGTEYSNSATLTPPTAGTGLTANVLSSNAALTAANAIQMGVVKIYVETDY